MDAGVSYDDHPCDPGGHVTSIYPGDHVTSRYPSGRATVK